MSEQASKRWREHKRRRERFMRDKERRDRERDERVTEAFGSKGHGECGRKTRFGSQDLASRYAIKYSIESGKQFSYYKCPYCDGWHLTSHPRKGSSNLMPSDVLERMREAVIRLRAIDAEEFDLHERIGVQGHSYGVHSKNGVLDPMRKVDDMLDQTADMDEERRECGKDVSAGMEVIDGLRALDDASAARLMTDGEYMLSSYYLFGMDMRSVADGCGQTVGCCELMLEKLRDYCDEVGLPRLRAAARKWRARSDGCG